VGEILNPGCNWGMINAFNMMCNKTTTNNALFALTTKRHIYIAREIRMLKVEPGE